MKRAAVVIARDSRGRLLAVSRPDPPLRYGFPGGGVELGESYEQAARRELKEETGLVAGRLALVYADMPNDTAVAVFLALDPLTGQLRSSHEGLARWVNQTALTGRSGAWPIFTQRALRAAGIATFPPRS